MRLTTLNIINFELINYWLLLGTVTLLIALMENL